MSRLRLRRQLRDAYRFPGFVPLPITRGTFGDPHARVVSLKRREKKQPAAFVVDGTEVTTMPGFKWCETYPVAAYVSTWRWKCGSADRNIPPARRLNVVFIALPFWISDNGFLRTNPHAVEERCKPRGVRIRETRHAGLAGEAWS